MIFRQLFDNSSHTYTYLMASGQGREALIIDPVLEQVDPYLQLIKELNIKLAYVLDTHTHADHITGSGLLKQKLHCKIAMGEQSACEMLDIRLQDHETLNIDGLKLKALYTPGHTDDSYCYLVNDRVFTGDTLLIRGTGRTDFQSGDAKQQYQSIQEQLFTLNDATWVYPAHDYKGMMVSTIGEEKQFNPRLQAKNAEQYAAIMEQLNLPRPKLMDIAIPRNLKAGLELSQ